MIPRLLTRLVGIIICLAFVPQLRAQQAIQPSEYLIKAAFLYNFAKFVEWPSETFPEYTDQIIIGILGKDPFGDLLERTVERKTAKGKEILVKRFGQTDAYDSCHILFISSSEKEDLKKILEHLRESSVLTVGDIEDFAQLGGIIGFLTFRERLRFEINVDALDRTNLEISSKMLRVAKIVKEKS